METKKTETSLVWQEGKSYQIDPDALGDLVRDGLSKKDIAHELGISSSTVTKKIKELQKRQGVILNYRALQHIELTAIQCRILSAITPDKIEDASLSELVQAYKILKEKELVSVGKPEHIKGLVGYLFKLEQRDLEREAKKQGAEVIDVTPKKQKTEDGEEIPDL